MKSIGKKCGSRSILFAKYHATSIDIPSGLYDDRTGASNVKSLFACLVISVILESTRSIGLCNLSAIGSAVSISILSRL